ncbi:MAG: hypothetical protein IAE93_13475 [Ignavibacteria bacterium]|nr:hypothetical protein [Ignavibacteria bacterium]
MDNIQNIFKEIYDREEPIGDIFLKRTGKEDREWLILGYMTRMLKLNCQMYPVYAIGSEPHEPDFRTFDKDKNPFAPIEITEVQHPNRKRGDEYKKLQKEEKEWNKLSEKEQEDELKKAEFTVGKKLIDREIIKQQIVKALKEKYKMRYHPSTWLLIYFNIPYGHFAGMGWWHSSMLYIINEIIAENIELQKVPYSRVLMTDCEGDAMIQIYPEVCTIKEAVSKNLGEERHLDKW